MFLLPLSDGTDGLPVVVTDAIDAGVVVVCKGSLAVVVVWTGEVEVVVCAGVEGVVVCGGTVTVAVAVAVVVVVCDGDVVWVVSASFSHFA